MFASPTAPGQGAGLLLSQTEIISGWGRPEASGGRLGKQKKGIPPEAGRAGGRVCKTEAGTGACPLMSGRGSWRGAGGGDGG